MCVPVRLAIIRLNTLPLNNCAPSVYLKFGDLHCIFMSSLRTGSSNHSQVLDVAKYPKIKTNTNSNYSSGVCFMWL